MNCDKHPPSDWLTVHALTVDYCVTYPESILQTGRFYKWLANTVTHARKILSFKWIILVTWPMHDTWSSPRPIFLHNPLNLYVHVNQTSQDTDYHQWKPALETWTLPPNGTTIQIQEVYEDSRGNVDCRIWKHVLGRRHDGTLLHINKRHTIGKSKFITKQKIKKLPPNPPPKTKQTKKNNNNKNTVGNLKTLVVVHQQRLVQKKTRPKKKPKKKDKCSSDSHSENEEHHTIITHPKSQGMQI